MLDWQPTELSKACATVCHLIWIHMTCRVSGFQLDRQEEGSKAHSKKMQFSKRNTVLSYLVKHCRLAVTWTPINKKCWPCRKGKMTFLTFVCPSCSASPVWLFHHPIACLCAKIGALDPSNDRKRHNEILYVAGVSTMLQMIFSLIGTFPFLISWFLGY